MMILFMKLFANIKCFDFKTFIRASELLNDAKKMRKVLNILFPL